ncbi:hypothetical protein GAYE_PCTG60G1355 [Galdieria yellowstonensis]|uniref:Uncharacterized protein n=1 Tax=Galdieria yellowstonensis TaxID=3028027 RepID=A0AAV9I6W5_9RHOD|nr:hypothetical protein GAYE_PCTG60G1355 [Galdieria yellowstonensis]
MVLYKSLSIVLQLRSGEMFPLTLHSLNLPENPTIDDFRRSLLNTELAGHPYYAYLQRFCRFGYSMVEPQAPREMLYIRPLRDNSRLRELLCKHQEKENCVTFYIEQTRSMKNEPCVERPPALKQGTVVPCNGSKLSNVPLILEATAFSPVSSSNLAINNNHHEQDNEDCLESNEEERQFNASECTATCSGDVSTSVEMSYSDPSLSSPFCNPMPMMNYFHLQEPYVVPCMTPLWQCHGYWVFPPFYDILPPGSINNDMPSNCYL